MNTVIDAPIFAIALSPNFETDKLAFVASQAGLFKSNDGGVTWESLYKHTPFAQDTPTTALALSPNFANDQTLFAAISGAILYSYDCGESWQISTLGLPSPIVSAICISPNFVNNSKLFVSTLEDGVFSSTDRGKSFERCSFHLYDLHVNCITLSSNYHGDTTLWVGNEIGVFRSLNDTHSWQETAFPIQASPVLSLAVSEDNTLYAGTLANGLFESTDGGDSWQPIVEASLLHNISQIIADKNGLFLLSDDGLYHLQPSETQYIITCLYKNEAILSFALHRDEKQTFLIGHSNGEIHNSLT